MVTFLTLMVTYTGYHDIRSLLIKLMYEQTLCCATFPSTLHISLL